MANMLTFYTLMYYLWFGNGQDVDVLVFVVVFGISNLLNMLIFFHFIYYVGFENGQHDDALVLVVLFWIFEVGQHGDVLVCVEFVLDWRMVNMLVLYNFMS